MNIVSTGVRSVKKRSWTFLGVKLQHFGSERVMKPNVTDRESQVDEALCTGVIVNKIIVIVYKYQ